MKTKILITRKISDAAEEKLKNIAKNKTVFGL